MPKWPVFVKPTNYDPFHEKIIEIIHIYSRLCMFKYVVVCSTYDACQINNNEYRNVQSDSWNIYHIWILHLDLLEFKNQKNTSQKYLANDLGIVLFKTLKICDASRIF